MILIIDNYDSFTYNLVQRLGELDPSLTAGEKLRVVRNDRITASEAAAMEDGRGPSHLIISPGPCTPAEAGVSNDMIARFAGQVPILGVCLGHQCMGAGHGMTVARHTRIVHGKTSPIQHDGRGLFAGVESPMIATRYHSLVVLADTVPPLPKPGEDGWEVTARCWDEIEGEGGEPLRVEVVMGLRRVWGDPTKAPLEGVQFHPESFLTSQGPRLFANFLAMGDRPVHIGEGALAHALDLATAG